MPHTIIAHSLGDAYVISRALDIKVQGHWPLIKAQANHKAHLYWGIYPLVVNEITPDTVTPEEAAEAWPYAYVQPRGVLVDDFIEDLKEELLNKKAQELRIAHGWMRRYPVLHYEIKEWEWGYSLIVQQDTGRGGVALYDYFQAKQHLEEYTFKQQWHDAFDQAFSHLHIRIFRTLYKDDPARTWEAHAWLGQHRKGQVSVGWEAYLPLSAEDYARLDELDDEAAKALEPGMFFCTQCQTAQNMANHGGFLYADTRCKDCATPEWLHRARTENYN
jgi:hypothetical protein